MLEGSAIGVFKVMESILYNELYGPYYTVQTI